MEAAFVATWVRESETVLQTLRCERHGKTGSYVSFCFTYYLYKIIKDRLKMDGCVVRSVSVSSRLAAATRLEKLTRYQLELQETSTEVELKGHRKIHQRSERMISYWSRRTKLSLFWSHISSSVQRKLPLLYMCIFTIEYKKWNTIHWLLNRKLIQSWCATSLSRTLALRS